MAESTEISEEISITDLDRFIRLLTQWHTHQVAQLEHLLDMPEGVEATLNDTDTVILRGDAHKAFLIGITTGLTTLGKLPFVVEFDKESTSDD